MHKPIFVNISGCTGVGTTYVCTCVATSLKRQGFRVKTVELTKASEYARFIEDVSEYNNYDVVIFDKHPLTVKAANQNRNISLFGDERPNEVAVLLTCSVATHAKRNDDYKNSPSLDERKVAHKLDAYNSLKPAFFGAESVQIIGTDGYWGLLAAAGEVKDLILSEFDK